MTFLKNIELFIKKRNFIQFNNSPSNQLFENLLKDEDKCFSDDYNEFDEIIKNCIILTKEDLKDLEKKIDEEMFEDIKNIVVSIDNPLYYNYFTTSFLNYKQENKIEKYDSWLKGENLLKKMDIDLKSYKTNEKDVFKNILNFDVKYQRIMGNHLKKIEKIKENLENINLKLITEKENFEIKEKFYLPTFEKTINCLKNNVNENIKSLENFKTETKLTNNNSKPANNKINVLKNNNINSEFEKNLNQNFSHFEDRLVSKSFSFLFFSLNFNLENKKNSKFSNEEQNILNFTYKTNNENKKKTTNSNQNIFLNSNVFSLIDQEKDLNSVESYSTDSEKIKNPKLDNNFITDEDSQINIEKNIQNSIEINFKIDCVEKKIINIEKPKKNLKKKSKRNKKKKSDNLENENNIEDLKKEKEEEEKFHKYIENFASRDDDIMLPSSIFLFDEIFFII